MKIYSKLLLYGRDFMLLFKTNNVQFQENAVVIFLYLNVRVHKNKVSILQKIFKLYIFDTVLYIYGTSCWYYNAFLEIGRCYGQRNEIDTDTTI